MVPLYFLSQPLESDVCEIWRENIEDKLSVALAHAVAGLKPAQINLAISQRLRRRLRLTHVAFGARAGEVYCARRYDSRQRLSVARRPDSAAFMHRGAGGHVDSL